MPGAPSSPSPSADTGPRLALAAFGRHYAALVRFLRRRTGCPDAAHELAHETWLRLADHARRAPATAQRPAPDDDLPAHAAAPSGHDPARAYIYTVAARLALNRLRGRERQRVWLDSGPAGLPEAETTACADPARTHELRQAVAAIDAQLARLAPRQRQVLLAHRLDGTPHAELAQRHGVSVKTIERDMAAGMAAMQAALHQWRGEAAPPAPAATPPATSRRGRRRTLSALLGLGALGLAVRQLWQHLRPGPDGAPQWTLALHSGTSQLKRQRLPDGSTLTLDADSRAEVAFFAGQRQVTLTQGGAFFDVAPDAARPFVVRTTLARITVLGTRFGVDWLGQPGAPLLGVAVQSGRVQVQPLPTGVADGEKETGLAQGAVPAPAAALPPPLLLTAGQRLTLDTQGHARHARLAQPDDAAAWQRGWLVFDREPLGSAVQRLARYQRAPLRVAPAVAHLPVLGRVRIALAHEWLRLLPATLPVRVHTAPDGSVDIGPR